ncbi:ABC-type transport system, involved in lipoprotein release, permease component [Ekhidna lutea]|uniref:ABC-type transport system, involved in lipoprotein release, permease component n=1 Tax=Ekhidna lutea TaxID=447679 RepID=A0A239ECF8_EKHLU|nr:FtsX-like permease family protein [Ekhidna lutea]SNS42297.1 ABC-type transport system, involved in lipoprotein release, permease component [Ekhidna lutea]
MKQPPKYPLHFFRWFCHPDYVEDIEGDLLERFEKRTNENRSARWLFALDVLRLFRPGIIQNFEGTKKLNYYGMFKHNLLISLRGFKRHKAVFGINLIGLITSLTCVLFSVLWINDELQKDRFHAESDKLFQVHSKFTNVSGITVSRGVTGLIEPEIETQIPQAVASAVSTDVHEYTLSINKKGFRVKGRFADFDYLKLLDYPLLSGDATALNEPTNILITKSLAMKMFGKEDVVGETLDWHFWSRENTFQIAGILEDVTSATSEPFEFILPWTFYHDELINYKGWGNFYGRVLVKLDDLSQKSLVEEKLNEIFQANQSNENVELFLTGYSDRYLYGKYENGEQVGGRIEYVKLTSIVAAFILLIACINFVNLSTAFASLKAKEIGVKKSFGASKRNLAFQFFFESLLLSFLATLAAILFVVALMEPFNQLTGKQLSLLPQPMMIVYFLLFIPIIGIIAGLYPAIHLSRLKVITALKSKVLGSQNHKAWGRQTLVLIQFSLSILLIVGTLIVSKQMDYALNKNLGYDRDNLLYFLREGQLFENGQAFISELESIPGVQQVSETGFSVSPNMQNRTGGLDWVGKGEDQQVNVWENNGDAHSVDILGLELVAGRTFQEVLNNEKESVIFNETAIRMMGIENPIGKTVEHYTGKKEIIGIVKDFTTESLHNPMEPAMFFYRPERAHYIMVKMENGKEFETIEKLETLYKEFNPSYPFEPKFVDQDYQAMYDSEMRMANLSHIFSGLAILISCLGLFGLTIFQVQRKVKEIGIKKVLGCDRWKLALSMTYNFTKAVFLAIIITIPISYLFGLRWLENYAESVQLSMSTFAIAAGVALLIAWITVGSQTIKAANANPVDSLKDE